MSGTFETNVELMCFSSFEDARRNAGQLAAACGGMVAEIGRIVVSDLLVTFHGSIPRRIAAARLGKAYEETTSIITSSPSSACSLSTTWNGLFKPSKHIGYLVLNDFGNSITTTSVKEWDDESGQPENILCRFRFERVLFSLPSMTHGLTYCEICGCQIPEKRVLAVPNVRRCVMCQEN